MRLLRQLACLLLLALPLAAQNTTQQLTLSGLLTQNNHGNFPAALYAADGTLYLLLNEQDGIRVLHADGGATTLLAQAHTGAAGDTPIAAAVDPAGNLYVTGTTTSGTLTGTSGTPFPVRTDTSTNSFLAKYDANLNLLWLTFLGAGRTSATAVTATADAVFVTGLTYSTTFPVTPSAIQQSPALNSLQNGFVERFSADGATLAYATYLTGANGDTTPTALAADSSDNAYIAGSTTASGYPTLAALIPDMVGSASGFLTRLTPAADGITFSTFIPGNGLTSLALDASTSTLLLSGNVSIGSFPVAAVNAPLVATQYQTLLRIPTDGQSVTASTLLVPGTASSVAVGPNSSAWISGSLTTPLFPGTPPLSDVGDTFLLHVTSGNALDQTVRFGGLPADNATYASLTTIPGAPAISSNAVALPGQLTTTVAASLSATERFDLPQLGTPSALLPSTIRDVPTLCSSGQCTGTAAALSLLSPGASGPSLALSLGDLPNLTLRNLGSATATGLSLSATGFTLATDCAATLDPGAQCSLALTGSGPGSITVSAANTSPVTTALPANTLTPDALALSTYELDFGAATSANPVSRTLTLTNLTATTQTFSSALDHAATTTYTYSETATDCTRSGTTHTVGPNASCHITLTLTPSISAANDGPAQQYWLLGTRDIALTGFAQAAAVNVSATTIDFGTQFMGASAIRLPRYLYLSNNSASAVSHGTVTLGASSPFTVNDECPATLAARSVCRLTLNYLSPTAPADDATTLTVDNISVTVQGKTLPQQGTTGSATNPNLSVAPATVTFATAVNVTGISGVTQTVTVKNTGSTATPLALTVAGDFTFTTNCPATLAAGASCQALIAFTPTQPGTREGLLAVATTNTFAPTYVTLTGTGTAILPANNGTLALGQTFVGEPLVAWYKIQQPLTSLTAASSNPAFTVALVTDTGSGHGTLPASAFASSITAPCSNCWLGVQFLSGTAGAQSATLELTTTGKPYDLTLTATALPVQGLLLSPLAQDFGTVAVHSTSARLPFTLTDLLTNSAAVTIQSITVTGDFALVTSNVGGAPCTGQLASTASCFLSLTFSPTTTGQRTGTLTIVTSDGAVTSALTGYATPDPGLALSPTALDFENVSGTQATQQAVTLTNTSGAAVTISAPSTDNAAFTAATTCNTLAPNATCNITVIFQPQQALASATLTIPVTTTENGQASSTNYAVPLTGNYTASGIGLTILPSLANFGSLATGALGQTREFTLTNNTGKTQSISLAMPRQFPLANATACPPLAPGASCVFFVSFLPVTSGEATGTLTATASDGTQALAYMIGYGNGSGTLSASPGTSLSFGQVASGQTSTKTITLTNTGTASLTIRRVTSQPPFFATTNCGATLSPNAACTVALSYTPVDEILTGSTQTTPRNDTGALTVESDASTSLTSIALAGSVTPVTSSSPASGIVLASFALSSSALTFANTAVGSASAAQMLQLTNTGTTTLHITGLLTPSDYSATTTCATLLAAQSCSINVIFAPNSGTSTIRSGTLEILSDAATSLEYVTLFATSTPSPLTLSPTALDFGTVTLGASGQLALSVTNNSAAAITFLAATSTGDYSVARGTCPANNATLAAGSSCTLNVTFTPTATGTRTGTLALTTDATPLPLTVALTGNATSAHLQISPGALAFGAIAVGSPASLTLTLLNAGNATVANLATTITGPNAADFAVTVPCPVSQLAPNQGCAITLTYTPSTTGNETAALNIASSDPASPLIVPLTGTGFAPGNFTLTVNGSSSAILTVPSGSPAIYSLLLTPLNGFTGQLALTCTPISAAQYASCSVLASSITLNGAGVQASTATINTITSMSERGGLIALMALAVFPFTRRHRRRNLWIAVLVCLALLLFALALLGCGGSKPGGKLLYTPAGTYQYQVTATTTSGPQISHTVTLNLIVQ